MSAALAAAAAAAVPTSRLEQRRRFDDSGDDTLHIRPGDALSSTTPRPAATLIAGVSGEAGPAAATIGRR